MLSLLLAAHSVTWDAQPFWVDFSNFDLFPFFKQFEVHLLTGSVEETVGASGLFQAHCVNSSADYKLSISCITHESGATYNESRFNVSASINGTAHDGIMQLQTTVATGKISSGNIELYTAPPLPRTPGAALVYGPVPPPPPPPPPSCATSYDEAACHAVGSCEWCESDDKLHALCFDKSHTPTAGWSCQQ